MTLNQSTTTDYRVTVVNIKGRRTRGFYDRADGYVTFLDAVGCLLFGVKYFITIYDHGRLVGRAPAGRWLMSPQRVADRMIARDMTEYRYLYNVRATISA